MHPIGEAARQSGVGIETIRYYEREGIVPAPPRSPGGRRLYDPAAVARLRFVRRCRDLGFPMEEVRALMALSDADDAACGEVLRIGAAQLDAVRDRIAALRAMEAALEDLVAGCAGGRTHCPALDRLMSGSG